MSIDPHLALEQLLIDLFAPDDLHRLLRYTEGGSELTAGLPSPTGISQERYVHAAVEALRQRGLVNQSLFTHLLTARPRRAPDILAVCALHDLSIPATTDAPSAAHTALARPQLPPTLRRIPGVLSAPRTWFRPVALVAGALVMGLAANWYRTSSRAGSSAATATPACGSEMAAIPAGRVRISRGDGTDPGFASDVVAVAPYCISKLEISAAQYASCAAVAGCSAPGEPEIPGFDSSITAGFGTYCNSGSVRPDHPANCVTRTQAARYCAWRGWRLPTEAEWQRAAQPDLNLHYPWGNDRPTADRLNAAGSDEFPVLVALLGTRVRPKSGPLLSEPDGHVGTAPVGSFPGGASPFGVEDMAGNVAEWVSDDWAGVPGQSVLRGSMWTTAGNADGSERREVWASFRKPFPSEARTSTVGFRCAY